MHLFNFFCPTPDTQDRDFFIKNYKLAQRGKNITKWKKPASAVPSQTSSMGSLNLNRNKWEIRCGYMASNFFFSPSPLHWRAKCKCHSFEKSSQVQVLPPYISLTSVNVVAMAPGYLLNARCTFAEIIRSISQRKGKQLNLQNKGHWSRYFWGAPSQNNVGNNQTREGTPPRNISLHWGVRMSSVSRS